MPLYEFHFTGGEDWTDEEMNRLRPLIRGDIHLYGDRRTLAYQTFTGDPAKILEAFPTKEIALKGQEIGYHMFERLTSQLEAIERSVAVRPAPPRMNEHVNVAIPGLGLLMIKHVAVLEDCCTDKLQKALDDGWHLLAVCPQEARRPDYILGRQNDDSTVRL
jgi:hypothetical protein